MRKSFHHASLDSPRLQKLLRFLRQRGDSGCTPIEICHACNSTRATSDLSELAANGIPYEKFYEGETATRRKVWRYRIPPQFELNL